MAMSTPASDWPAADAELRRAGDLAVGLAVCGYVLAAAVGLPLFQDGSFYFFYIVIEQAAAVPNLRFSAVLPQLPAVAAFVLGADLPLARAIFSAAYMTIPVATLVGSWWLLRSRAPVLLLLLLPSFLALQLNLSGVSELLSGLYLTWPMLLAMLFLPERRWVMAAAIACGPLFLLLHPIAFVLCFGLGAVAWLLARPRSIGLDASARLRWRRIGYWLLANGLARVAWSAVGLNDYERGRLEPSNALNYLFADSVAQHLLLVALVGAILAASWTLYRCPRSTRGARVLMLLSLLALLLSIWVGAELLRGHGIALKSAITLAVGLLGMAALTLLVLRREAGRGTTCNSLPGAAVRLLGVALLIMLTAKSSAWWTGVRGLQDLVASSEQACIPFGADQPYSLQWPWMVITDAWSTPFTALVTRPFVPSGENGFQPVAVLLSLDGCELLHATGVLYLPIGVELPFERVDAAFGPLRRPESLAQ